MKKAVGVVLLWIGIQGLAMLIPATLIGTENLGCMSLKVNQALFLYGIFISLVVGGVATWGWDRWRIAFGIVLTGIGGFAAFAFLGSLPAIMKFASSGNVDSRGSTESMIIYVIGVILFSLIFIIGGITLITLQRKKDKVSTWVNWVKSKTGNWVKL